jgi:hypothetical protein
MATLNKTTGKYEARKFFAYTNEEVIGESKDTGDKLKDKAAANADLKKKLEKHLIAYPPFAMGLSEGQIATQMRNGKIRKYQSMLATTGRQFNSPGFTPFRNDKGEVKYIFNPSRKISTMARSDLAKVIAAEVKAENDKKTKEAAEAAKVTDGK